MAPKHIKALYKEFTQEISIATDLIELKRASQTARKGTRGFVDNFVFSKVAWMEAMTYYSIFQAGIILLGLMDDVIDNANSILRGIWGVLGLSNPLQIPMTIGGFLVFGVIIFFLSFGIVGYKYIGLPRRQNELNALYHPGFFMVWLIAKGYDIKKFKKEVKENGKTEA